jgi:AmpD protein
MTRGWVAGARRVLSPNCDSRPPGAEVSLLVLHSISLPRGRYGGDEVERLFTNRLDPAAHSSFADLAGLKVSAHFLIRRDGELVQFVPLEARAWHAGASRWRGRERCNDFSVGIELEGVDDAPFAWPASRANSVRACRCARSPRTATSRRAANPTPARASIGRACSARSASAARLFYYS